MSTPTAEARPIRIWADVSGRTEVGPTRRENQDAIMVATVVGTATGTKLTWRNEVTGPGVSVAVVDGMGGYAGGSDAAALAAVALAGADPATDPARWDGLFEDLSARIADAGRAWGTPDMGATAAMLAITRNGLVMVNVGDCRIYRVTGGLLGQLSVDDRTDDPDSSAVTQALGGTTRIDAHAWEQAFQGVRERFVLCSDGVWGTLGEATLKDLCAPMDRFPQDVVDDVIAAVYELRATDNCSIIVADVTGTTSAGHVPPPANAAAWQMDIPDTHSERRGAR